MAGEYPLNREEEWQNPPAEHESVLDRRLTLSLSAGRWIAVVVALAAATLLRLPGLNRWAFSAAEAEIALTARDLILGNDVPSDLLGRPFLVEWAALFMFIGDPIDTVARMSMAVAGIVAVVLMLALGRWIGIVPATASAVLLAFSPTMVANSRRLDGGMLIVCLVLLTILCALYARERTSLAWPALLGISFAALILSGPLGLAAALIILVIVLLAVRPGGLPATSKAITGLVGFLATYVLVSTALFTRPAGLINSTSELFRQFFRDHLYHRGGQVYFPFDNVAVHEPTMFHVPFINLIVNEPLLIGLGIVGLLVARRRELSGAISAWFVLSLGVVSVMGDTGIAGHALVVLPLTLLAGLGAARLIDRLPWGLIRRGPAAVYVAVVLLLFFAVVSVIGLLTPEQGLSGWEWAFKLLLIVGIVILPLTVGLSLLARRITGHQLVLVLSAGLLLISAVTVRSAVLAASERPGEPMDPLAQGGIAASLPATIDRIERVSIDLTRTERTAQDPTGGHGLIIAIDEAIEQPLRWYFRDFPNVTIFDPATESVPENTQVAFLAGDVNASEIVPGLVGETYLYNHAAPEIYRDPDWGDLLGNLFQISEWRHFVGFMIERTEPHQDDRREFQLLVTPGIGDRLFGPSGPFAIEDMAGTGIEGGQFNAPRGIAVAEDGSVFVVDAGNHRVQIFDAAGEFVRSFGEQGSGPGQFASFGGGQGGAGGIAVAGERVYVADTWNHRIQVFGTDGEYITEWGAFFDAQDIPEQTSQNPGLFYGPRGIAIHDDLVYVTDTGNERVQVFDLDGEFVQMFGATGSDDGQLLEPVGIAVAGETVYVADSHNARIARFTLEGEPQPAWDVPQWQELSFFEPFLAATTDDRIFATTSASGDILVFSESGDGADTLEAPDVVRPFGIAVRPGDSSALVTDGVRNAVLEVNVAPQ